MFIEAAGECRGMKFLATGVLTGQSVRIIVTDKTGLFFGMISR